MKLILASQSPRRRELLQQAGFDFTVEPCHAEELYTASKPSGIVTELAEGKAGAVFAGHSEDCMVLGADTIVAIGDEILGKPKDEEEARRMIRALSGREHQVYTGVCLLMRTHGSVRKRSFAVGTDVYVKPMSEQEIRDYVSEGESLDKAGAYAIQGGFRRFIERFDGDYENVIGLPVKAVKEAVFAMQGIRVTDDAFVRKKLPPIPRDAHKYTRGRLLLIAGSYGMAGAAILSARAALRTGVGYLNLAVPQEIYGIAAAAVPEAVFTVYDPGEPEALKELLTEAVQKADAVVIGPGLGKLRGSLTELVWRLAKRKLLLDADALNALSEWETLPETEAELLLTPHAGEMARLLKREISSDPDERMAAACEAAWRFHASVLLKGPHTLIAPKDGGQLTVNTSGNAGLARAGSGDVLSGIIGGLMAAGVSACDAAAAGAYLHGKAAELAAKRSGLRSVLPSDLVTLLPEVLRGIEGSRAE